jgi:hypothetical protein
MRRPGIFKEQVHQFVSKYVPGGLPRNHTRQLWMNRKILISIWKKERVWKTVKNRQITPGYRQIEKSGKMMRKAKRNLEKKLVTRSRGNYVRVIICLKRRMTSRPSIGPLQDKYRYSVTNSEGKATLFNKTFQEIFIR